MRTILIIITTICFISCDNKQLDGISSKLSFNKEDSTIVAILNNNTANKYFYMPYLQEYFNRNNDDKIEILQYSCDRIVPERVLKENSETEKILNKKAAEIVFNDVSQDMLDTILAQQAIVTIEPKGEIKIIYKIKVDKTCKKGKEYRYYLLNGISGYRKYRNTQYRSHPHLFEQINSIQADNYKCYNKDFFSNDTIAISL
jgi:hypothetical protein